MECRLVHDACVVAAHSAGGAEQGGLQKKSDGDKKKKSPWREGKGPRKGGGFKGKGGDKPGTGEAQRNKSFFEARKAGKAGQPVPKPGGMESTVCLCCRQRGHLAKHCPQNANQGASKKAVKGRCYNCGEEGQSIHACTKPKKSGGKLEFATCFVCKEQGHISSQCPQNER